MPRGKQYIKNSVYRRREKKENNNNNNKKKKNGKGFRLGVQASVGVMILSEIAKPILKKIIGRGKRSKRPRREIQW